MEEQWTILKVLQWTAGYFSRKGIEQPRANAEVLLAHVLGVERIQLYLRYDQPLSAVELARFREAIRRRASREPTQYITRRQEFWSLEFEVGPCVLIPRPETEVLVEKALEVLGTRAARVLDLGTGSGAIAIALAHERPALRLVATDRSHEALHLAKTNAIRHGVEERIHFVAMDLFSALAREHTPFDLIATNPPYIGESEFAGLAPEVACHEPEAALKGGGSEGLSLIRRILSEFPPFLEPGGTLLVEIGHNQADTLGRELYGNPEIDSFEFIRDYSGIPRVLNIRRISR